MPYYNHSCIHCGSKLILQDQHLNKKIVCPSCNEKLKAPAYLKEITLEEGQIIPEIETIEETMSCPDCSAIIGTHHDVCPECNAPLRISERGDSDSELKEASYMVPQWVGIILLILGLLSSVAGIFGVEIKFLKLLEFTDLNPWFVRLKLIILGILLYFSGAIVELILGIKKTKTK